MMKALLIESCTECPHIIFDNCKGTDDTFYCRCILTDTEMEGKRGRWKKPPSDCPLPDYTLEQQGEES